MGKRRKLDPLGNLKRAERKISRFPDTYLWCGCITPCEALALLDDGGRAENSSLYDRAYLMEKKAKGECRPSWFYFYPTRTQMNRWLSH